LDRLVEGSNPSHPPHLIINSMCLQSKEEPYVYRFQKRIIFKSGITDNWVDAHVNTEISEALLNHLKKVPGVDNLWNNSGRYRLDIVIGQAFAKEQVLHDFEQAYLNY
jgi:hypothetical protein